MAKSSKCSPEIPNISWIYRALAGVSIVLISMLWCGTSGPKLAHADGTNSDGKSAKRVLDRDLQPDAPNAYQAVTGDDSDDDRQRWDALFSRNAYVFGKDPAPFLKKQIDVLPVGRALDIAMGEGRNAVFLAKKGFQVDGVDYSEVALRKARKLAKENGVSIRTINADLNNYTIRPESYQVIVNIDFLQRNLIPEIKKGLRHGGMVVFENATVDQLKLTPEQSIRRDTLLEKGELKAHFKDFQILVYEEKTEGREAKVRLIARKP